MCVGMATALLPLHATTCKSVTAECHVELNRSQGPCTGLYISTTKDEVTPAVPLEVTPVVPQDWENTQDRHRGHKDVHRTLSVKLDPQPSICKT